MDTSGRDKETVLYEDDFYSWTQRQAALLREGRLGDADIQNIAEEIETLGRAEISELRSRYKILSLNLLKKIYQPNKDGRSWTTTIVDQRQEIEQHLSDNPGLKPKRITLFLEAYAKARRLATAETQLPTKTFPATPPFSLEEAESETYWPLRP